MTKRTTVGTQYAIRDSAGLILCHTASQTRKQLKSTYRARYRSQVWAFLDQRGLVDIARGTGMCVACGLAGTLALNDADKAMPHTLTIGHDIPDSHDGPICGCNALPLHEACNRELGDVALTEYLVPYADPREFWEIDYGRIKRVRDLPNLRTTHGAWQEPDKSQWLLQGSRMTF